MKELVLVSGSGRGLGSSVAKAFTSNGFKVAIKYFKSEYGKEWKIELDKHLLKTEFDRNKKAA